MQPRPVSHNGTSHQFSARSITRFSMAPSVVSVGVSAFESCRQLLSLEPLSGTAVVVVKRSAFARSGVLSLVGLPNRLKEIQAHAFSGCSALSSLAGLPLFTDVHRDAFYGCLALLAAAQARGFQSVGDWVRARRVRFTVLLCVARARRSAPESELKAAAAAESGNARACEEMAAAMERISLAEDEEARRLLALAAVGERLGGLSPSLRSTEAAAAALAAARDCEAARERTESEVRALTESLFASAARIKPASSALLLRVALLPDELIRAHIIPCLRGEQSELDRVYIDWWSRTN
ncbi:hypothetical protein TeGR_g2872 [Tetraparma gracilis]|uniref:Leucine-rich repeat domain-containing protein n=1 Tax=Tetraparma gracilis TaxID=2962635 RepID=A0ABQ6MFY5_9STRA|nr:hypothetical protein TeGR_g2872 [Tetraparma gracilis]